jgi:hypothetical protein
MGGFNRLADFTGVRHALSRNFQNHVAFLDATYGT